MKTSSFIFLLPVLLLLSSFKIITPKSSSSIQPGTYGVCECEDSQSHKLELKINADHTFAFTDHSNMNKKIDIEGTWILRGSQLVLTNYTTTSGVHKKWKLTKNKKCIRSRKGLNFYRLCAVSKCN